MFGNPRHCCSHRNIHNEERCLNPQVIPAVDIGIPILVCKEHNLCGICGVPTSWSFARCSQCESHYNEFKNYDRLAMCSVRKCCYHAAWPVYKGDEKGTVCDQHRRRNL
jgi:hypothetical protein